MGLREAVLRRGEVRGEVGSEKQIREGNQRKMRRRRKEKEKQEKGERVAKKNWR